MNPAKGIEGVEVLLPSAPSESLKVMDLTSIHHPDALCHFNGVTHVHGVGRKGRMREWLSTIADDALQVRPGV